MFITLEGPDGSGKSTQTQALAEYLRAGGLDIYVTREPGGTTIGDQIRQILLDHGNQTMLPRTEILLFVAARAQHVEEVIRPRLQSGQVVLCDRYIDSTLAYQGYGYERDVAWLRQLNTYATDELLPDLTLLLDLDAETGLSRRSQDGEWNRLDAYALAFHQRVREGYCKMVAAEPDRWAVIDGGRSEHEVQQDLRKIVVERLVGSGLNFSEER